MQSQKTPSSFIHRQREAVADVEMSKRGRRNKTVLPVKFAETPTVSKEKPVKLRLVTDTSCQGLGKMTWDTVYNLLEKLDPKVTVEKASVPDEDSSDSDSDINERTLANSFLHRIAARASIMPYYDVVRWVIDSVKTVSYTHLTLPTKRIV